jgi:putative nucleotidyltransferase with HDIG domain
LSIDKESIKLRLTRLPSLPSVPAVVTQIMRLADDPRSSSSDFERVIRTDPALSAKVLRTVNSAYYGLASSEVTSLRRAISLLGMATVKSITLGVAFRGMFGTQIKASRLNRDAYWCHSLAVAAGAKTIAAIKQPGSVEEAFMAGLLHDIGKLIIDHLAPEAMEMIIQRVRDDEVPMYVAEQDLLGCDHAEIGDAAAEKWALPSSYRSAIAHHHRPGDQDSSAPEFGTVAAVHMANQLAHEVGFDLDICEPGDDPAPIAADYLDLPPDQWGPISAVVRAEVEKALQSFSHD